MAGSTHIADKAFKSGPSGTAIRQFRCVTATATDTVKECDTAGQLVIGVNQQTVAAADSGKQIADVRIWGITLAIADGSGTAIAVNDRLVTDNQGRVVKATATTAKQNQVGLALNASSAAGDQINVLLTPGVQIDT